MLFDIGETIIKHVSVRLIKDIPQKDLHEHFLGEAHTGLIDHADPTAEYTISSSKHRLQNFPPALNASGLLKIDHPYMF